MTKPLVYLVSPYTLGHITRNVRFSCLLFKEVVDDGIVDLYPPLWSHLQDLITPVTYEQILAFDFAIIRRCDALLRVPAILGTTGQPNFYYQWTSEGADREVGFAQSLGIPVFYAKEELYTWAQGTWPRRELPASTATFRAPTITPPHEWSMSYEMD